MPLSPENQAQLHSFFQSTNFSEKGAVITDLDGTAIHEWDGRYGVPIHVEEGLRAIYDTGRPIIINTLRFPLSVIRTFGREWYQMCSAPIPTVLLNGAQLGYIHEDGEGMQRFEELSSFPLSAEEITEVLLIVAKQVAMGLSKLLVFYYPRNWERGEVIWTPSSDEIPGVREKYKSAEEVWSGSMEELGTKLKEEEINMVFLHADMPSDDKMAYQHSSRRDFFTSKGVNKLSGTRTITELLGVDLGASLGAGDTSMDVFLAGVAQAVHVGRSLAHHGSLPTISVKDSEEYGALLLELAKLQRERLQAVHA
jgi:hydroxymethylpyrimidine pyrophosphatase-like HAD family hydrolase